MSIRENIIEALVTAATPVVTGGVYRSREAAIARSEGPALVIRPQDEKVETRGQRVALRDLVVQFEVIVRGQIPDQDADPIVEALHAAITADPTLGGIIAWIFEEETKWDFEIADMNAVSVTILYRCRYLTAANSLSSQP